MRLKKFHSQVQSYNQRKQSVRSAVISADSARSNRSGISGGMFSNIPRELQNNEKNLPLKQ